VLCSIAIHQGFIFPNNINLKLEIESIIDVSRIPQRIDKQIKYNSKSQFWFGDVNGCLILKNIPFKIKHEQRRDFITIKKYRKALHCNEEAFENLEDTDFITDLNINSAGRYHFRCRRLF
jgi:hypothetical protein